MDRDRYPRLNYQADLTQRGEDLYTLIQSIKEWVATDTETTGLRPSHGDRPFMATTWSSKQPREADKLRNPFRHATVPVLPGTSTCVDRHVDPKTRKVTWDKRSRQQVADSLTGRGIVLFNAPFDLSMYAEAGMYFNFQYPNFSTLPPVSQRIPGYVVIEAPLMVETQVARHVIDNRGPKGLKLAARYYAGVPSTDERDLKHALDITRNRASKLGWKLGTEASGKSAPKADYWIIHQMQADFAEAGKLPAIDPQWGTLTEKYGRLDTYRTLLLWLQLLQLYDNSSTINPQALYSQLARQLDAFVPLYWMERSGLALAKGGANLSKKLKNLGDEVAAKEKVVLPLLGVSSPEKSKNPRSGDQLRYNLFDPDGPYQIPVTKDTPKTETGLPETDKTQLKGILATDEYAAAWPLCNAVLDMKRSDTRLKYVLQYDRASVINTNLAAPFPDAPHRRVAGNFNQTGTDLTRFSASRPNLQNIGKEDADDKDPDNDNEHDLRSIFGPGPGRVLLSIDYNQLELRLFARVSNDPTLIRAFKDGLDLHSITASAVYGKPAEELTKSERKTAKYINFGIIYGAGPAKINRLAGTSDAYDNFIQTFPGAHDYMQKTMREARQNKFIYTLFGYRLWVAPEPAHKAVNMQVQGLAGDIAKEAMTDLYKPYPLTNQPLVDNNYCRLVVNVHDELVFDVRLDDPYGWRHRANHIADVMESQGRKIGVHLPVSVDVCPVHWGHSVPLNTFNPSHYNLTV